MVVRGIMTGAGIGADLRVERRVAPGDPTAKPLDHRGDDMVGPDAQPVLQRLQRQMAVADMPGDAQQVGRGLGGDLDQRLGGGTNPNIAAIVEFEPVAIAHMLRPRQIEQKRRARIRDEADRRRCRSRNASVTVSIAASSGQCPRVWTAMARRMPRVNPTSVQGNARQRRERT